MAAARALLALFLAVVLLLAQPAAGERSLFACTGRLEGLSARARPRRGPSGRVAHPRAPTPPSSSPAGRRTAHSTPAPRPPLVEQAPGCCSRATAQWRSRPAAGAATPAAAADACARTEPGGRVAAGVREVGARAPSGAPLLAPPFPCRGSGSSQAARSSIATTNTQQAIRAAARGDISAHSATRVGAVNAHVASSNPWAPWPTFGWMPLYYGRR
jgi:hypothetical protein